MDRPLQVFFIAALVLTPLAAQDTSRPAPLPAPLLEMRVDHPEQFPMPAAHPSAIDDGMPRAKGPAPPCERKSASVARVP